MHSRHPYPRHVRVASQLQREIAPWLRENVPAPWHLHTTVTRVEVTRDLSYADVYVLAHEGEDADALLETLNELVGELQRHLGAELRMKRTPRVRFVYDEQYEHAANIERIIQNLPETSA